MKYFLIGLILSLVNINTYADLVAKGTIKSIAINSNNIALNIIATQDSPCSSGNFYSFDSDSTENTVNRLLSGAMSAQARGVEIKIYSPNVVCDHSISSKFSALTISE